MQLHKEYEIMILKVIAASFTIQLKKEGNLHVQYLIDSVGYCPNPKFYCKIKS